MKYIIILTLIIVQLIPNQAETTLTGVWNSDRSYYTLRWENAPSDSSVYYEYAPGMYLWLSLCSNTSVILYRKGIDQQYAAIVGRKYVIRTGDGITHATHYISPNNLSYILPIIVRPK